MFVENRKNKHLAPSGATCKKWLKIKDSRLEDKIHNL